MLIAFHSEFDRPWVVARPHPQLERFPLIVARGHRPLTLVRQEVEPIRLKLQAQARLLVWKETRI